MSDRAYRFNDVDEHKTKGTALSWTIFLTSLLRINLLYTYSYIPLPLSPPLPCANLPTSTLSIRQSHLVSSLRPFAYPSHWEEQDNGCRALAVIISVDETRFAA